jgi:hypothetical protein
MPITNYQLGEANGFAHGLKYVFNPDSYARLAAAVANPQTASDATVAAYADDYYRYDGKQRGSRGDVQGAGASSGTGIGSYTESYSTSANAAGYNSWAAKSVDTLPDGTTKTVYTNAYGEPMLNVFSVRARRTTSEVPAVQRESARRAAGKLVTLYATCRYCCGCSEMSLVPDSPVWKSPALRSAASNCPAGICLRFALSAVRWVCAAPASPRATPCPAPGGAGGVLGSGPARVLRDLANLALEVARPVKLRSMSWPPVSP